MRIYIKQDNERMKLIAQYLQEDYEIVDDLENCDVCVLKPTNIDESDKLLKRNASLIIFQAYYPHKQVYAYLENDLVKEVNGWISAYGCIMELFSNVSNQLKDYKVLVMGQGNCGLKIAYLLKKLSINVTSLHHDELDKLNEDYDAIIYTCKSLVFDEILCDKYRDTLILDIVGVFENMHNYYYLKQLPLTYGSNTSAKVIANYVKEILDETKENIICN